LIENYIPQQFLLLQKKKVLISGFKISKNLYKISVKIDQKLTERWD